MRRLFIFNPETDFCLASNRETYTPPANVTRVRRALAMIPLRFASPADALLILDGPPDDSEIVTACAAGVELVTLASVRSKRDLFRNYSPVPWGWNRQIRHLLLKNIGEMPGMISERQITALRDLSHRRMNIRMFDSMRQRISPDITTPQETDDTRHAIDTLEKMGKLYFKAPWSSSGRGVLFADCNDAEAARKWIAGTIRRQGSVIMEKAYDRALDFATEWFCKGGKVSFLGYSVFNVSFRGKYQSNITASQSMLLDMIKKAAPGWNDSFLALQQHAIEQIFASEYDGPLGVDMLVTDTGDINPSVEVNLRHTMGMPGLLKYNDL